MNQYHIYEAIGRGKHSTVYKGRKKKTIDYYAIKSVEKTQKSRVLQEVRTLHSLDHPNVLKFYAWYETSAHLWLVLEYCVGGDLLTLLRQDTSLPEESIHDFARDLVQALQFLHSKGVIYCDLKPSNVLLDENGRLKLCDFGLARRLSDISKSSVQQLPQAKRGTPCYMAPELFQEGGVHSFSSDLWALGCVMYECYAGRPPFVSTSFTQLVSHILSEPTPSLQGSPSKELEDLVGRLLIKDPAQRLQWPELREHPFWRTKFKSLPLPPQPAFQKMTSHGAEFGALKHSATVNTTSEKIIPDEQISSQQGRSTMKKGPGQAVYKKGQALHAKGAGATENTPAQQPFNQSKLPGYVAPLKEDSGRTNGAVNLLRLSKIVKSNLQRESEGGNYRQQGPKNAGSGTDITIENNDLELDFAEQTEDDGDDEDDGTRALTSAGSDGSEDNTSSIAEKGQSKIEHDQAANFKVQVPVGQYPKMNGNDHETLKAVEAQAAKLEAVRLEAAATPPGLGQPRKAQRFAIFGDQKKATPTSAIQGSAEHAKPCLILSQALWHSSDLAVRPVMIFRRNEKMAETTYDARMLPVESLSSSELLKLPPEHLETFVNKVVVGVNSHTPLVEKLNTLKYLEGLCTNVDAANILINGPIMNMLIKMLRTSKPPTLRVQLVCVMGLLIRHATLIDEELANSGIIAILTEGLRDKQDKMRRCSMATLGELLFYIATQSDSSPRSGAGNDSSTKDVKSSSTWQVPNTLIALVSSILRKGEDDITQHYALKTIENVASQGGEWAARFTSHDVLENLCYIFKASVKQENLRSTAGSCLVRLVRFSPSNIPLVLEKLTFKDLVAGLTKGSPKEQQVNVNLLNMALVGSSVINNMGKYLLALLEEKSLVPSLVAMLEQGTEVLRGKAFVCAALLCKINRKWLPSLCNAKLLPTVERLTKEKDTYVQQCVEALVQTLVGVVPGILESISMDIQQLSSGKRPSSVASHGTVHNGRSQIRSSIPLFPVVLHLFSSPIFRHRIVNEHILKQLTGFMNRLETSFFQGEDEFQLTLLRIIEVIGQESSVLLGFPEIFILQILPSLAILYKKNTDGDMRFLCLKILFDSLVVFLDNVSNSATTERNEGSSHAPLRMEEISQISKQHFLPLYPTLIEDEDPIPMYAQNLLVMLLDIKCIKVSDLFHLMPLSKFFDFLCADLSSITLHSVRLCLFLASAAEVETSVLSELRLVGRVGGLLDFVHAKGMDDFLDPSLSLCRSFLIRSCAKGNVSSAKDVNSNCTQSSSIQDISEFGRYAGVFLELCSSKEPHIAEAAAECLVLVVNATPRGVACTLISCLSLLAKALESCTKFHAPHVVSQIQRRLLLVLCAICKEQRMPHEISIPPEVSTSDIDALQSIVTGLRKSNSQTVADAAIDAALELQLLPHRS